MNTSPQLLQLESSRSIGPRRWRMALALLCLAATTAAHAQGIHGVVMDDSTHRAIEGATLTLIDSTGREIDQPVRSAEDGKFALRTGTPGIYRVKALRIGYQPVTSPRIELGYRAIVEVQVRMSPTAAVLAPMRITSMRRLTARDIMGAEGFEYRKRIQTGVFLDSMAIAVFQDERATDIMMSAAGGRTGGRPGEEQLLLMAPGGFCHPVFYFDGRLVRGNAEEMLNTYSSLGFYGIEIYRGKGNIPIDFPNVDPNACGLIAIWTKAWAKPIKK